MEEGSGGAKDAVREWHFNNRDTLMGSDFDWFAGERMCSDVINNI